jgi:NAD(P)-dependent dehydrogenase (short-subunit alcohol dehydrogenase family)
LDRKTLLQTVEEARRVNPQALVEHFVGDLTTAGVVDEALYKTVDRFGHLDYAVNIAGISGKLVNTDVSDLTDYRRKCRKSVALSTCRTEGHAIPRANGRVLHSHARLTSDYEVQLSIFVPY